MFIQPTIFKEPSIVSAQSTRNGGVSPSPFNSLNLGLAVNDNPEYVTENRMRFFNKLGIDKEQLVLSKQVHGKEVFVANTPCITEGYDALITNQKNLFLAVSIADCTPILIYDSANKAVAAIHAGWKGTVAEIVTHTLTKMNEMYGTEGVDCYAYIGACISFNNFEVNNDVAQHFNETLKKYNQLKQKWFIDLKEANNQQLKAFGVPENNIEISTHCTVADEQLFFSHRRDKGNSGRMMAVIGMK
ncbi:MAG: peptidoglycan editing factor PgeF [Bacteroidia bacterium]